MAELPVNPGPRVEAALQAGRLQEARSLVFHWLQAYLAGLPPHPLRQQLREPELWSCLADVVERTSDQYLLELFWQAMDRIQPAPLPQDAAIPLLGVPILNRPDLLDRLLASLDHPVHTLAIVDNSCGTAWADEMRSALDSLACDGHPLVETVQVARPFANAGVAASWNLILRGFPDSASALLVNNDVQFAPGVLASAVRRLEVSEPQFLPLLPAPQEFSAFWITAACWDRVGLFDPGFFPAYCEDLDFRDRLRADSWICWPEAADLQARMAASNCEHSLTITSDADFASHNRSSFALNRLWYLSHRRLRHDPRGTWLRQWLAEWKD